MYPPKVFCSDESNADCSDESDADAAVKMPAELSMAWCEKVMGLVKTMSAEMKTMDTEIKRLSLQNRDMDACVEEVKRQRDEILERNLALDAAVGAADDHRMKMQREVEAAKTNLQESASTGGHGIHAWCIVQSTAVPEGDGHDHTWRMAGGTVTLVLSMLILTLQVAVTLSIAVEAAHPRCTVHGDCRLGEYCAPTALGGSIASPGWCEDCYWAAPLAFHGNAAPRPRFVFGEVVILDSSGDVPHEDYLS